MFSNLPNGWEQHFTSSVEGSLLVTKTVDCRRKKSILGSRKDLDKLEGVLGGPPSWQGSWSTCAVRGGWGCWACSAWRRRGFRRPVQQPSVPVRSSSRWPVLSAWQENRRRRHRLKRDVLTGHQETCVHCEHGQALEKVTKRGCAVSILGGLKDLTGWQPEQPGLASHLPLLWAGGRT